jgi:eukaryotic-like serine/threonine-protein kinase
MAISDRFRRLAVYGRSLSSNRYFWAGFSALLALGAVLYILINYLIMPMYTRHDVSVTMPDVTNMSAQEAERVLAQRGLRVQYSEQRFTAGVPRDVVIDQSPAPNARVKPGRRVYISINTGDVPQVTVPHLEGYSLREATSRLRAAGLRVAETRPDTIPAPYPNTITRQDPRAGAVLSQGQSVRLWYSTGLGQTFVEIPDVTGLSVEEAREALLSARLRSVVIGEAEDGQIVARQSRPPGTRVREGFEIRLFLEENLERVDVPPPPQGW